MMKYTFIKSILFFVFILQSCVFQTPQNNRQKTLSSSSTSTNTNSNGTSNSPATTPTFLPDETVYWYSTQKVLGTITLNKNIQDVIYLRGKYVHDFLNKKDSAGVFNYKKQFCLVGNFTNSGSYTFNQLRVRALPINYTNTNRTIEKLFRIEIPNSIDNKSSCQNTTSDASSTATIAYSFPEISSLYTGYLTTKSIVFYENNLTSNILLKVDSNSLTLTGLAFKIDMLSNATDPNTCSNSSCAAKGFDCCISGQCVKDGTEKLSASLDPQYNQAKLDVSTNPLAFINYPNIYNICANIAHTPPSSSTGPSTTPISDAEARVKQYKTDWTTLNTCDTSSDPTTCQESASYITIKNKLAYACGCNAPTDQIKIKCPDWGVKPVYSPRQDLSDATKNIVDFYCYTPAPPNPIGPITNLNVTVSNRSAPHRFYDTVGKNYDDLAGLSSSNSTLTQEGADFYYLDEYNKFGPVNNTYNINSVLGRMKVDLSRTIPAKQVTVEVGKTYILSSISGYFTPCSLCTKDSWYQMFTAHPTSQRGAGLQATGYTTSRDTHSNNTTLGNYEDTKFGRACYVPPTMLPFAHKKDASKQTQRLNRLKTQAAYYINGYQRDWYGFNKGALIGSFDGVTWFAVGNGRRITATSTKLFLALNGAFLDLAEKTDTIVNIIPDFSANLAADLDYNPELLPTDPRQNSAATCQQYHQCSNDADCVTQLGWEYVCADVSQFKTKWPVYDGDGVELTNQEKVGSIVDILNSTTYSANTKRCVYRGAGSPCKRDYSTFDASSANNHLKKSLTCAPNFYCAAVTSNKFNDELVRSPNEIGDILFGMDANVLGRPINYVTATKSLDAEIISAIKYNAQYALSLTATESDDFGICRPGKYLGNNALTAHMNPDASKRTDYISQIASCDSTKTTGTRFLTCPAFDDDLNYIISSSIILTNSSTNQSQIMQNICGGESRHTTTLISAFKSIEALSLASQSSISAPTLVQDACLRRAGSICHTDLDCGPNKMHEDAVPSTDLKFFGGTEAEQSYWKESLVCGQGTPIPGLSAENYFNYKLNENRCCREIGKDFTMYTQGPKSIVPENAGTNENLNTAQFTYLNPGAINRYSRYSISKSAITSSAATPRVDIDKEPAQEQWKVINETGSKTCCGGGWIRKFADGTHDWTIKNRLSIDNSNFSCLNFRSPLASTSYSNFVADKVDQTGYQREYGKFCMSPVQKGCLQIPFQKPETDYTVLTPFKHRPGVDLNSFLPGTGAVTDRNWDISGNGKGNYHDSPSVLSDRYARLYMTPRTVDVEGGSYSEPASDPIGLNSDVPYIPDAYFFNPTPLDVGADGKPHIVFEGKLDYGVSFYLPAYIGVDRTPSPAATTFYPNTKFIKGVYIKYYLNNSKGLPRVIDITSNVATDESCLEIINSAQASLPPSIPIDKISSTIAPGGLKEGYWCITKNALTQNRYVMNIHAHVNSTIAGDTAPIDWGIAGVIIDFEPIEQVRTHDPAGSPRGNEVTVPGSPIYYLNKLSRLELLGIPQITYEPLYCNNDKDKVVPGIFKSTYATRTNINASFTNTYSSFDPITAYNDDGNTTDTEDAGYGNDTKRFAYQDKVDHAAVFSSKDFTCCTPLGKEVTDKTKCCSGFGVTANKKTTCALPTGTDLNVYFNKFVSSEGVGADQPGGGLTLDNTTSSSKESDFNAFTGEPKNRESTWGKLQQLGRSYCANKQVTSGSAFGRFPMEPFSGSYFGGPDGETADSAFTLSIVDSIIDVDVDNNEKGKIPFDYGYRWNNHLYCK